MEILAGPVDKALLVLDALDDEPVRLSELARRTGLAKSTVHRLLAVLVRHGMAERTGAEYIAGSRLRRRRSRPDDGFQDVLRRVAVPYLLDLHKNIGGVVALGTLSGSEVRCLEAVYRHRWTPVVVGQSEPDPAHCTAMGKLLLAYEPDAMRRVMGQDRLAARTARTITSPLALRAELARVRREGVAWSVEEHIEGIATVAGPVCGRHGQPVAAVSISGRVGHLDRDRMAGAVRQTGLSLTMALRVAEAVAR